MEEEKKFEASKRTALEFRQKKKKTIQVREWMNW